LNWRFFGLPWCLQVLKKKKLDTKTLFDSNFVLAMVVLERVLEMQFQGL
jgi:hypothetical protein